MHGCTEFKPRLCLLHIMFKFERVKAISFSTCYLACKSKDKASTGKDIWHCVLLNSKHLFKIPYGIQSHWCCQVVSFILFYSQGFYFVRVCMFIFEWYLHMCMHLYIHEIESLFFLHGYDGVVTGREGEFES